MLWYSLQGISVCLNRIMVCSEAFVAIILATLSIWELQIFTFNSQNCERCILKDLVKVEKNI